MYERKGNLVKELDWDLGKFSFIFALTLTLGKSLNCSVPVPCLYIGLLLPLPTSKLSCARAVPTCTYPSALQSMSVAPSLKRPHSTPYHTNSAGWGISSLSASTQPTIASSTHLTNLSFHPNLRSYQRSKLAVSAWSHLQSCVSGMLHWLHADFILNTYPFWQQRETLAYLECTRQQSLHCLLRNLLLRLELHFSLHLFFYALLIYSPGTSWPTSCWLWPNVPSTKPRRKPWPERTQATVGPFSSVTPLLSVWHPQAPCPHSKVVGNAPQFLFLVCPLGTLVINLWPPLLSLFPLLSSKESVVMYVSSGLPKWGRLIVFLVVLGPLLSIYITNRPVHKLE